MLNTFFVASIKRKKDVSNYQSIVDCLEKYGKVIVSGFLEDVLSTRVTERAPDPFVHSVDSELISSCDVFVADVTNPSTSVGYQLREALEHERVVVCLYDKRFCEEPEPVITDCSGIFYLTGYQTLWQAKRSVNELFNSFVGDRLLF